MKIKNAEKVLQLINENAPIACSVALGYLVRADGRRVLFADYDVRVPRVENEKRNAAGRCTSARMRYADGSVLLFDWSEQRGARYRVGGAA